MVQVWEMRPRKNSEDHLLDQLPRGIVDEVVVAEELTSVEGVKVLDFQLASLK